MEPITFNRGIIRSYMKGQISCDQNLIDVDEPTSVLWLIPTGHRSYQLPLAQVASVVATTPTNWFGLVISVMFILCGVGLMTSGGASNLFGGIIVVLIFLWAALHCMPGYLVIATTAGQEARVKFTIFERGKAAVAARQLNQMIAHRMDDTNVRVQTDRVVNAINNK